MPLKSCPALHGEAQEATALRSRNNWHAAAYAPRYLSGPGEQWLAGCWHKTHGTGVRVQASYICRCPKFEESGMPCLHSLIFSNTEVPFLKADWLLEECLQELSREAGCSWSAAPNKAMAAAPARSLQAVQCSLVWQSPCRSRTLSLLKHHPFTLLSLKIK